MNWKCFVLLLGMPLVALGQATKPEPFEDALREAVKQYRAGKPAEARAALDKAKEVLDQNQAKVMQATLPDGPQGWKAGNIENETVSPLAGGGKVMKRAYLEISGKKEMRIEVSYDSPAVKLINGLAQNDAVAEGQGYKVKRASGERVLVKVAGDTFEIAVPLDERVLVKILGSHGATEDEGMKLLKELDRRVLKEAK